MNEIKPLTRQDILNAPSDLRWQLRIQYRKWVARQRKEDKRQLKTEVARVQRFLLIKDNKCTCCKCEMPEERKGLSKCLPCQEKHKPNKRSV